MESMSCRNKNSLHPRDGRAQVVGHSRRSCHDGGTSKQSVMRAWCFDDFRLSPLPHNYSKLAKFRVVDNMARALISNGQRHIYHVRFALRAIRLPKRAKLSDLPPHFHPSLAKDTNHSDFQEWLSGF
jgi:hypothetical protein